MKEETRKDLEEERETRKALADQMKDIEKETRKEMTDLRNEVNDVISTRRVVGVCGLQNIKCGKCRCREDELLLRKYYCDCTDHTAMKDCLAFKGKAFHTSGVYFIKPKENVQPFQVN